MARHHELEKRTDGETWGAFGDRLQSAFGAQLEDAHAASEAAERERARIVLGAADYMDALAVAAERAVDEVNTTFGFEALWARSSGSTSVSLILPGFVERWYLSALAIVHDQQHLPGVRVERRSPSMSGSVWFPFVVDTGRVRLVVDGEVSDPQRAVEKLVKPWFESLVTAVLSRRSRV